MRRDVKFEEERAFRRSRESEQGEQQVPAPQVVAQVPSTQQSGSQVYGVTGPQSVGTCSPGSVVRPAGSSGTGDGSTITGTPYRGSRLRLQGTPSVGTPALGSQVTEASSSSSSSDDDRPVREERSGKKKPKWLWETLKDALKAGTPRDKVKALKIPNRLGMLFMDSTRDSQPSTFE